MSLIADYTGRWTIGIGCGIESLASRTSIERDLRKALLDGRDSILPQLLFASTQFWKFGVRRYNSASS